MGAGLISAVNTVPCSRDADRPCPSYSAAKVSSAADSCHAAGVAIKFDVGASFDESVAAWAAFFMPAVTWCIGSFARGAHSDRSQVVTGNCAPPTTLEAVLIKAAITAYSACMRRLGIAIILGGAPVNGSMLSYAYTAVAARPQSAGLPESPVVIHGYNQLQFPSLQASAASIVTA